MAEAAGGVQPLCELLGVHKTTLYRWIRGERALEGASATAVRLVAQSLKVKSPTES
jgi:DNA-binding transcriptional regulator YdaS (Cro superfamily)